MSSSASPSPRLSLVDGVGKNSKVKTVYSASASKGWDRAGRDRASAAIHIATAASVSIDDEDSKSNSTIATTTANNNGSWTGLNLPSPAFGFGEEEESKKLLDQMITDVAFDGKQYVSSGNGFATMVSSDSSCSAGVVNNGVSGGIDMVNLEAKICVLGG